MTCTRCHGLMIERPCWERDSRQVSHEWPKGLYMWVCMNCGNRLDRTIAINQAQQAAESTYLKHARIWTECKRKLALLEVG